MSGRLLGCCLAAGLALAVAAPVAGEDSAATEPSYTAQIGGEDLHANTLEFAGLAFRDVVAKPRYEGSTLVFTDCQATAYGGRVTGEIRLNLDTGAYHCHCEVEQVDLGTVLKEFGGNNAQISGVVNGWADLDIPARHVEGMTGKGSLSITHGSLVQLPLLANLLIGDPVGSKGRDRLTIDFSCHDSRIHILPLANNEPQLVSPACRLRIIGTIGFDGNLNLRLPRPEFRFTLFEDVPALGKIVAQSLSRFSSHVVTPTIRGQVTKPVLMLNAF